MDKWTHAINENSILFQGHPQQLFSSHKISFKIKNIYEDPDSIRFINVEHFRRPLIRQINKLLEERKQEGYECEKIIDYSHGLDIKYPKLFDQSKYDYSGKFEIYPKTATCSKCHRYIRLNVESDYCSCKAKLKQFTFVAICDVCGAYYPLHPMSNILNDCAKCKTKNGLKIVHFDKEDDIGTYKVSCINCGYREPLIIYKCDHKDHQTEKIFSDKPKRRFRAVPARSNALMHPYVLSFLNIVLNNIGNNNTYQSAYSEAFNYFLKDINIEIQESALYLPSFWNSLVAKQEFWERKGIKYLREELKHENTSALDWDWTEKLKFIQEALVSARNRVINGNELEIRNRYGIDIINECLNEMNNITIDELEEQGLSLLKLRRQDDDSDLDDMVVKEASQKTFPNEISYFNDFGIEKMAYVSNLQVIQALLGTVSGSTKNRPLLFSEIMSNNKPTVYIRKINTEAIYFKLKSPRIMKWLEVNDKLKGKLNKSYKNHEDECLRTVVNKYSEIREDVYKLLHTFSHTLIQKASINTGLDNRSMSEKIFPSLGLVLIYSTNSINIGSIEYTFDNTMSSWLNDFKELAEDCPQDPACMLDEGGACISCLFLPEFVCENFNEGLDRDCLIGDGTVRYKLGFLNVGE